MTIDELKYFYLKSFQDQFKLCINKTLRSLYIGSRKSKPSDYPSNFNLDTQNHDEFKIEDNITYLNLSSVDTTETEYLSKLLQDNIQPHFKIEIVLNDKLLSLGFKVPSHGIKKLTIEKFPNFQIPVGFFPQSLETLDVWSVSKPFIPGVLPSSLRTLRIAYYSFDLQVGTLPPHLTVLELDYQNVTSIISDEWKEYSNQPSSILPKTLTSLSCTPRWLPLIKSLPSLDYLLLCVNDRSDTIDLSTAFPRSLTELRFEYDYSCINENNLIGTLPSNITRVDLPIPSIHSGLFSTSTYYEEVYINCRNLEPISSNIKIHRLIFDVDRFNQNFDAKKLFPNNESIHCLEIYGEEYKKFFISLPSSVKELNFPLDFNRRSISKSITTLITPSLQKIHLDSKYIKHNDFFRTIPSNVCTFILELYQKASKSYLAHFRYTLRRINSYQINDNVKKQYVEEFIILGGIYGMEGGIRKYIYSDFWDHDENDRNSINKFIRSLKSFSY